MKLRNFRGWKQEVPIFKRTAILLFCIICAGFTAIGNFPDSVLTRTTYNLGKYFYGPFAFWQGWGMYTQSLTQVAPVRYRYDYQDGSSLYYHSPYGYQASMVRTELGNLDVYIAWDNSGVISDPVLAYYCREPQITHGSPLKSVSLEVLRLPVPSVAQPNPAKPTQYLTTHTHVCLP